jgi:hypothetical protein
MRLIPNEKKSTLDKNLNGRAHNMKEDREMFIVRSCKEGRSFVDIAGDLGISRERVRQIASRFGITGRDRLRREAVIREKSRIQEASRRSQARADRRGLSVSEYQKIAAMPYPTPFDKHKEQKRHARDRGIPWLFVDFGEWWDVWALSGKWDQRGRHAMDYVMSRVDDLGPYSKDNVRIVTASENISNARVRWWKNRNSDEKVVAT